MSRETGALRTCIRAQELRGSWDGNACILWAHKLIDQITWIIISHVNAFKLPLGGDWREFWIRSKLIKERWWIFQERKLLRTLLYSSHVTVDEEVDIKLSGLREIFQWSHFCQVWLKYLIVCNPSIGFYMFSCDFHKTALQIFIKYKFHLKIIWVSFREPPSPNLNYFWHLIPIFQNNLRKTTLLRQSSYPVAAYKLLWF